METKFDIISVLGRVWLVDSVLKKSQDRQELKRVHK